MKNWPNFTNNGTVYDLSHLDSKSTIVTREASGDNPEKSVSIFLSYSDHCFTDHYGEDDSWIYTQAKGYKQRYFCRERHQYSFEIDNVLQRMFQENVLLRRTHNDKREQFFHLDGRTLYNDYRLFLEIKKHHNQDHDIWMKVISAYPEKAYASPVGGDPFKIWRVIDAKQKNIDLPKKRRR